MTKKWIYKPIDTEAVEHLEAVLKIDRIFCELLVERGITTFEAAKDFFRPSVDKLHDPFLMKNMDKAVERLTKAIDEGEKIMLYGDYDVDGTTSVALMYSFLSVYHPNLIYYIPDRYKEGYGVSMQGITYAQEEDVRLIIAMDCGIKAVAPVAKASSYGIDFIICDHHLPDENLPEALAILDPKQSDCAYPYKELSGCGVSFKLAQAYLLRHELSFAALNPLMDLLAVSIACDIVPITGENRILAHFGLQMLNKKPRMGLKALIKVLGRSYPFSISDIVFGIGPSINAAGRLSDAKIAVQLLLANDKKAAMMIAEELKNKNNTRKTVEAQITEEAKYQFTHQADWEARQSVVVFHKAWHKGVVGIVAAKMAESYQRPSIVLTASEGKIVGSARTVADFDVHQAISNCAEHLVNYGGHRHAAGLTLEADSLAAFQADFEKAVANAITAEDLLPTQYIDTKITFTTINAKFLRILAQFAPFGPGNRRPVFVTEKVTDNGHSKVLKDKHLKLQITQENRKMEGIGFGLGYLGEAIKQQTFDVCYVLEENVWQGKKRLQLRVKDIKLALAEVL